MHDDNESAADRLITPVSLVEASQASTGPKNNSSVRGRMTSLSSSKGIVSDDEISAIGTVLKFSGRDIELEDTFRKCER